MEHPLIQSNASRKVLAQMGGLASAVVGLIAWKWDFISQLYFSEQLSSGALAINGVILALFLFGMGRMLLLFLDYGQQEAALDRFIQNQEKGSEDPLEGVKEGSIIHNRYCTMQRLSQSRVPINHNALASVLVASESAKNTLPKFVNNVLILAGVLGTIISLAVSLLGASNLLASAADVGGMGLMVHGMSVALAATITAIFCYLFLGYFYLQLTDVQTRLVSGVEQVTTNYLIPEFQVQSETVLHEFKGLIHSVRELVEQMQQSQCAFERLEQHIDSTLEAHESATETLSADIAAIKELLRVGFRLGEP